MNELIDIPVVAIDHSVFSGTLTKNTAFIEGIRPLSTTEAADTTFTGANSVVEIRKEKSTPSSESIVLYFSSASVGALKALAGAAISGVTSKGQVALVAGTKAITISGLTTANLGFVQLVTPNTASSTIQYKAVVTTDTLTITALVAAGTINSADISTVNYQVL